MSTESQKRVLLGVFKPFLHLLTYSNATSSANHKHRIGNLTRAIIFGLLAMTYLMVLVIDFWYCYGFRFDIRVVAFPFAIFINGTQLMSAYASLWTNNNRVEQAIDILTGIVDKRKKRLIF